MADGIRTRDRRHHKPELYQLSYCHRDEPNLACGAGGWRPAGGHPGISRRFGAAFPDGGTPCCAYRGAMADDTITLVLGRADAEAPAERAQ